MKKECDYYRCRKKPLYQLRLTNHKNKRITLAHYCPRHAREIQKFLELATHGAGYWNKKNKIQQTIKKTNAITNHEERKKMKEEERNEESKNNRR